MRIAISVIGIARVPRREFDLILIGGAGGSTGRVSEKFQRRTLSVHSVSVRQTGLWRVRKINAHGMRYGATTSGSVCERRGVVLVTSIQRIPPYSSQRPLQRHRLTTR